MKSHSVLHVEIDLNAVRSNIRDIRRIVKPSTEIMAVVKANAYGHGDLQVSKVVLANGASRLAVGRAEEALKLRKNGIPSPILILGHIPTRSHKVLISKDITLTVYSHKMACEINDSAKRIGRQVKVHIKVDTGMNRLGFMPNIDSIQEIKKICSFSNLIVEGIYTHFADADNSDKTYTEFQFKKFLSFLKLLSEHKVNIPIKHAANSAAVIDLPETHLDMVRPGIILYGLYPSELVKKERIHLKPAMKLTTQVIHVKNVEKKENISYGGIYTTKNKSVIATLPVGYADGFSRMLKHGEVLIHGERAPVVGRICMDLCMIDVSHIPNVKIGDDVVIYGSQGDQKISIEEVSKKLGTINYELICMVSSRVPRIYAGIPIYSKTKCLKS